MSRLVFSASQAKGSELDRLLDSQQSPSLLSSTAAVWYRDNGTGCSGNRVYANLYQ